MSNSAAFADSQQQNARAGVLQEVGVSCSSLPTPISASPVMSSSMPDLSQVAMPSSSISSFPLPAAVPGVHTAARLPAFATGPMLPLSSPAVSSATSDPSSSGILRPLMPTAPVSLNPMVQQQVYPLYPSVPPVGALPQPLWLQPPQMGGLPRPPFLPCPPVYPSLFPLAARGVPLPSVPLPNSQPSGVTPVGTVGNPGAMPASSITAAGNHFANSSALQPEVRPPGTEDNMHVNNAGAINDKLDAWSAHRTETGAVYYYNAVTGESTYEKPAGFRGEPEKVTAQPTPVSWEKLAGTDWALVSTNDGKKYYYNTKTKISSWQIPTEVTELKKKKESENQRENSLPVLDSVCNEKGSAAVSLIAPALDTGGRDSTPLRTSSGPGTSSALHLIKKKLQESGAPVTSPVHASTVGVSLETNGSKIAETTAKVLQNENSKDKAKDTNADGNISDSSSDSEDVDCEPTKEQRIIQFKEMLKERGVAPFSKWEKELPKIVFDLRFKAIPNYAERRSLFEHYVRTRAEEERKEKRAAQKAMLESFKQLLDEAKEDIDHNTDYHTFRKKWGHDPRFEALDRKEREVLLNERVLPLKKAAEEKAQAIRAAAASDFKAMLRERGDITSATRWSRVRESIREDPRYKAVKHEDRELLFNKYISELKAVDDEAERREKARREEQEKLKERERELRKRKEREEQEMERVKLKVRRKEAIASYQALLVETIKDPQASWTESKPKLEKDPQRRATNPDLDETDLEKLFREHVKMLHERRAHEFRALLAEVIIEEAAAHETKDGKTVLNSWSTAKRILKSDRRYSQMPRNDRESLWRGHVEEIQRRQKVGPSSKDEKLGDAKNRSSNDPGRVSSGSRSGQDRR